MEDSEKMAIQRPRGSRSVTNLDPKRPRAKTASKSDSIARAAATVYWAAYHDILHSVSHPPGPQLTELILQNAHRDEIMILVIVIVSIPVDAFLLETHLLVEMNRCFVESNHSDLYPVKV